MSASNAIGMVSESLRNLLVGELSFTPTVNVTILSPNETGGDRRINLFLYKVQENPMLKNMDWQVKRGEPNQLIPQPLSLNLFYLMTPYASNDQETGNSTAHEILGEGMRVFYENSVVPSEYLVSGLENTKEQIKIMQNTLNLEELSQVWGTFTQPFRLSVLYEVSVVQLDMLSESERAMARRTRQIGIPNVSAHFKPPVVNDIGPMSGPIGTIINFGGENLSNWKAYTTMMNRTIVDGDEITDNSFTMTIPAELSPGVATVPGFYEIKIDISHLFRRTFFFEVTL